MSTTELRINFNEHIYVELSEYGKRYLKLYIETRLPESLRENTIKHFEDKKDRFGRYKFQLWEFMHIFSRDMFMGSTGVPTIDNVIYLKISLKLEDD